MCSSPRCSPIVERPLLPGPKDDFVLELAVESRADFVFAFNTGDFVGADRFGVRVISPREFLAIIRRRTITLDVTVPDTVYRQIAKLAARDKLPAAEPAPEDRL